MPMSVPPFPGFAINLSFYRSYPFVLLQFAVADSSSCLWPNEHPIYIFFLEPERDTELQ